MKSVPQLIVLAGYLVLTNGVAMSAQPSFELDLKELDAARKHAPKQAVKATKVVPAPQAPVSDRGVPPAEAGAYRSYTVKPGDHIFKILLRDFKLSNAEAERLIPEIVRVNRVQDIRRLTIGKTLLIPAGHAAGSAVATLPAKKHPPAASVPVAPPPSPAAEATMTDARTETPVTAAPPAGLASVTGGAPGQPDSVITASAPAPPAMVPVGTVLAVSVNGGDPLSIFLRLAEVLQIRVQPNQVIESRGETAEAFSIKVPLYGEGLGKRLIVAGGGQDPFQYTLFRLLEAEGYGVLQFREEDRFRGVTAATLGKLNLPAEYGRYRLVNGKEQEVLGYLLETPRGKMLLTDAPVDGVWTALEIGGQ